MTHGDTAIEAALLRFLREPDAFVATPWSSSGLDELTTCAERHGVAALLAARLPVVPPWAQSLAAAAREHAAWELGHRRAVQLALAAMNGAGIEPVLFKGTALAYSVYPSPVQRSRSDTDLIVPPDRRETITESLRRGGFEPVAAPDEGAFRYQTSFVRRGPEGAHEIDVHWKISNSEVLSRLFSYDELRGAAVPLPELAASALAAAPVHAMLLGCMHRAAHRHSPYYVDGEPQFGGRRFIWTYDLHLLATSFVDDEWQSLVASAKEKGLGRTCADGLREASTCFGTNVPDGVLEALAQPGAQGPASDYLRTSALRQQWLDLRAVPGSAARARYLRELLLPPGEFVRQKYAGDRCQWLPWLYLRRAVSGAWRRLRGYET